MTLFHSKRDLSWDKAKKTKNILKQKNKKKVNDSDSESIHDHKDTEMANVKSKRDRK